MNITETLRRIQGGDRQAFALVVKEYQGPLFGFFSRMRLSQGQAEELSQETFLRAWKNLDHFDPHMAQFSTWLFTIARNLALNELARPVAAQEVWEGEVPLDPACEQPQPPDALALMQIRKRLQAALLQLSVADRCVVALAYISELELSAVARIEDCSVGAIKTRLHRARRKLFDLLEKENV